MEPQGAPNTCTQADVPNRDARSAYLGKHGRAFCHQNQHRLSQNATAAFRARELSHPIDTHHATYGSQHKLGTRPTQAAKRRKRKRAALFLSQAFKGLRETFLSYVSPAHYGTAFVRKERQKSTTADILHNDPGPWHEYGQLDSDTEDNAHKSHFPNKT